MQLKPLTGQLFGNFFPAGLILIDMQTHIADSGRVGAPDTGTDKHLTRFNVHIKSGSMNIFAGSVPELNTNVCFIRRFIFTEPNVAINSHQRPANLLGTGNKMLRNFT